MTFLPAHMSIGDVYEVERSSTSGARYHRVETLDYWYFNDFFKNKILTNQYKEVSNEVRVQDQNQLFSLIQHLCTKYFLVLNHDEKILQMKQNSSLITKKNQTNLTKFMHIG
jgi:hypothetical protein